MRYLLSLLNFPGTGPFVNRIKLLFGAITYVHGYVRAPFCLFSFSRPRPPARKPLVVERYAWRFHRRHKRCQQLCFLEFASKRNRLDIRRSGRRTNLRSSHLRSIRWVGLVPEVVRQHASGALQVRTGYSRAPSQHHAQQQLGLSAFDRQVRELELGDALRRTASTQLLP